MQLFFFNLTRRSQPLELFDINDWSFMLLAFAWNVTDIFVMYDNKELQKIVSPCKTEKNASTTSYTEIIIRKQRFQRKASTL